MLILAAKSIQRGENLRRSNIVFERSGYVLSHTAYPGFYKSNTDSSLTLSGLTAGQLLHIVFYRFDIKGDADCADSWDDSMTIHGLHNIVPVYCNSNRPLINERISFTVLQSTVTFNFKTSTNWQGQGFYFSYSGNFFAIKKNV